jgi:hypothetical protein
MPAQTDIPKVFISYSWKPVQHQQKVIELAERLMSDSVNVILDVWDLREGQDKNQFMERMVTDPEIKRVLVICNKDYKEKADNRKGGVGTESMIMSSEIYSKADQTKFIPLIFEADEEGNPYTPVFVHSRIYLDFKDDNVIEDSYEQLLRNIYDAPARKRPPLGKKPTFLDESEPLMLATAHRVTAIRNAFVNERKNANLLVKQYYVAFLEAIKGFEPTKDEFTSENFIDLTLSRIEKVTPLRDDFISFLKTYLDVSPEFNLDDFNSFFEEFLTYFDSKARQNYHLERIDSLKFDYLKFFIYELILYITAALLKLEKFSILAGFLHYTFIIFRENSNPITTNFRVFNMYIASLDKYQNERFNLNRVSVVADNVKQRASTTFTFDELKQADILLHHISQLSGFIPDATGRSYWGPATTAYNTSSLPIFSKIVSLRYFDKIKVLFDVQTKEEFIAKVQAFEGDSFTHLWYRSEYFHQRNIPQLSEVIILDKIGMVK